MRIRSSSSPAATFLEPLESRRLLSGVTLITHGQGGSANGDVKTIADLIATRAGGAAQYVMTVSSDNLIGAKVTSFTHDASTPDIKSVSTGEMIIRLDWSDVKTAGTTSIGDAVSDYMVSHGLVEQQLHLAGPSRGASVVSNLAASLGTHGVWVDQVTYIDPVPAGGVVPGLGDFVDGPMKVTSNVQFADDYWRSDNNLATGFDGQPVNGAHNVSLNNTVQKNNAGDPHVGAGLYYIATVDPTGPLPPDARSSWFQGTADAPARNQTGYLFSRILGAPRPKDGVGVNFGGKAHRDGVDTSGPQWSNLADVAIVGGTQNSIAIGKAMSVAFRYGDADSKSTVSVYLDKDRNPYNGNTVLRLARRNFGTNAMGGAVLSGTTAYASPGTYYAYAVISDSSGHVRFAYAHDAVTLAAAPPTLKFASVSNGRIRATGTTGNDVISVTTDGKSLTLTRNGFTQILSLSGVSGLTLDGGDGNDILVIGNGVRNALLLGGGGNDLLVGADGDDNLQGGAGRDRLFGAAGDDRLSGGGGNDYFDAGSGADRLYGDAGDDILHGGSGSDHLTGGSGADTLFGDGGTDHAAQDPLDQLHDVLA